ncbi:MAG: uracil-DNA glycosylase [Candidatus Zambryskibacteria bacterium RIFCSPHIGHO2_12_FULL_44_12b]|uniref:Type-4 uracil-DNA glycosylase n=1 Tax=Candidatus Zambryskibacteria bacterium RIFCSPLOWO2_01_FULL_45_21 TaxID=1802761 RepID=A0A1G2U5F1_9BACT|nr:MAG: uracil-DNA glycosylase [Candidatus Zambryskibacteria bacterium RIFCSPHIGHO2_12_FULL_44_12b]OHB04717.1 MAG: uracil-DNA glycosylase [Candidatus Zambryskibacteria bacterium RIFCSPLOWO2_01_FULL_45_21]
MEKDERKEKMKEIKDEILGLMESPLFDYRSKNKYFPVIGEGSHHAKVMFVGEAPGENEARTGKPFCGRAGKILDELLGSVSLPRSEVYVTNIVKDRPPGNRDPLPEEIAIYAPFLDRQIEIIKPKVVATLGRYSMAYILNKFGVAEAGEPISRLHGRIFDVETPSGGLKIVPLYHPAVAIYNQQLKPILIEDFRVIKTLI